MDPKNKKSILNKATNSGEKIRLSKRMSELGLCSRREADRWIERAWVKVDGKIIDELGYKIFPSQTIELTDAAQKESNSKVSIVLNKPVGYVSTQAEHGYKEAKELIILENQDPHYNSLNKFINLQSKGLSVCGRLDIESQGILLFTQDGTIAKKIIGEDSLVEKEYLVRVKGKLSEDDLKLLNYGLVLDNQKLKQAKVDWVNDDQLRFVLREGKKRQIRRMLELVNIQVLALKRVRIGQLKLGKLEEGKWRFLGNNEKI